MSDTRDAQAVRPWPVERLTVPPHPHRPAGPYCPSCGQHTGHWAGLGAFIAAVACWVIAGAVVILIARRWT